MGASSLSPDGIHRNVGKISRHSCTESCRIPTHVVAHEPAARPTQGIGDGGGNRAGCERKCLTTGDTYKYSERSMMGQKKCFALSFKVVI